jgi:YD repeat-containing protein
MVFAYQGTQLGYVLLAPLQEHATLTVTGLTTSITFPNGEVRTFGANFLLSSVQDRNGNITTLQYDANSRLASVTDSVGRVLTFNYASAAATVVSSIQNTSGIIAQYTYNTASSPNLIAVKYADNSQIQFTYSGNLITQAVDEQGKILETHTYDSQSRGLTSAQASGVNAVTVNAYSTSGSATQIRDSKGNTTLYSPIMQCGRYYITSVAGSGCSTCGGRSNQSFQFDSTGNILSKTDARGTTTSFTYDSL